MKRNKHCWDWWNLEALSDNEEVFEREEPQVIPIKPQPKESSETNSDTKIFHLRKNFVRAKSAEPESRLSRRKCESLPDVHKGLVGEFT